ncbi:hypothetical protein PROFUN_01634 [Planoprotostelium fungivorum]|uniref:Uncharacterized protein n=1 Tax=Planoprotostelium fungivorum TaxID=1890364 RepID=A0A2P6NTT5_9EUKA|nr:hypothetical protein PROFUN_01634 [Planoprotostelium fungivorum]
MRGSYREQMVAMELNWHKRGRKYSTSFFLPLYYGGDTTPRETMTKEEELRRGHMFSAFSLILLLVLGVQSQSVDLGDYCTNFKTVSISSIPIGTSIYNPLGGLLNTLNLSTSWKGTLADPGVYIMKDVLKKVILNFSLPECGDAYGPDLSVNTSSFCQQFNMLNLNVSLVSPIPNGTILNLCESNNHQLINCKILNTTNTALSSAVNYTISAIDGDGGILSKYPISLPVCSGDFGPSFEINANCSQAGQLLSPFLPTSVYNTSRTFFVFPSGADASNISQAVTSFPTSVANQMNQSVGFISEGTYNIVSYGISNQVVSRFTFQLLGCTQAVGINISNYCNNFKTVTLSSIPLGASLLSPLGSLTNILNPSTTWKGSLSDPGIYNVKNALNQIIFNFTLPDCAYGPDLSISTASFCQQFGTLSLNISVDIPMPNGTVFSLCESNSHQLVNCKAVSGASAALSSAVQYTISAMDEAGKIFSKYPISLPVCTGDFGPSFKINANCSQAGQLLSPFLSPSIYNASRTFYLFPSSGNLSDASQAVTSFPTSVANEMNRTVGTIVDGTYSIVSYGISNEVVSRFTFQLLGCTQDIKVDLSNYCNNFKTVTLLSIPIGASLLSPFGGLTNILTPSTTWKGSLSDPGIYNVKNVLNENIFNFTLPDCAYGPDLSIGTSSFCQQFGTLSLNVSVDIPMPNGTVFSLCESNSHQLVNCKAVSGASAALSSAVQYTISAMDEAGKIFSKYPISLPVCTGDFGPSFEINANCSQAGQLLSPFLSPSIYNASRTFYLFPSSSNTSNTSQAVTSFPTSVANEMNRTVGTIVDGTYSIVSYGISNEVVSRFTFQLLGCSQEVDLSNYCNNFKTVTLFSIPLGASLLSPLGGLKNILTPSTTWKGSLSDPGIYNVKNLLNENIFNFTLPDCAYGPDLSISTASFCQQFGTLSLNISVDIPMPNGTVFSLCESSSHQLVNCKAVSGASAALSSAVQYTISAMDEAGKIFSKYPISLPVCTGDFGPSFEINANCSQAGQLLSPFLSPSIYNASRTFYLFPSSGNLSDASQAVTSFPTSVANEMNRTVGTIVDGTYSIVSYGISNEVVSRFTFQLLGCSQEVEVDLSGYCSNFKQFQLKLPSFSLLHRTYSLLFHSKSKSPSLLGTLDQVFDYYNTIHRYVVPYELTDPGQYSILSTEKLTGQILSVINFTLPKCGRGERFGMSEMSELMDLDFGPDLSVNGLYCDGLKRLAPVIPDGEYRKFYLLPGIFTEDSKPNVSRAIYTFTKSLVVDPTISGNYSILTLGVLGGITSLYPVYLPDCGTQFSPFVLDTSQWCSTWLITMTPTVPDDETIYTIAINNSVTFQTSFNRLTSWVAAPGSYVISAVGTLDGGLIARRSFQLTRENCGTRSSSSPRTEESRYVSPTRTIPSDGLAAETENLVSSEATRGTMTMMIVMVILYMMM